MCVIDEATALQTPEQPVSTARYGSRAQRALRARPTGAAATLEGSARLRIPAIESVAVASSDAVAS
ncbi:hypothetical protein MWU77_12360 [Rhodococcus sp. F64268]|uniref:hypothetical protein n=1 Tax=Rhodococcus sp. F64268 TaxID=2926402 RepID=UPI001FF20928|nr:hypothetical protein [Rhodococcus sp. F64268]MCK0091575.1 hypothetical protein [Rhodococcus sp. F64268]